MEVSVNKYRFSHNRNPRGYGYWAFRLLSNKEEKVIWVRGYFKDAKAEAVRTAKAEGYHTVEVLP